MSLHFSALHKHSFESHNLMNVVKYGSHSMLKIFSDLHKISPRLCKDFRNCTSGL